MRTRPGWPCYWSRASGQDVRGTGLAAPLERVLSWLQSGASCAPSCSTGSGDFDEDARKNDFSLCRSGRRRCVAGRLLLPDSFARNACRLGDPAALCVSQRILDRAGAGDDLEPGAECLRADSSDDGTGIAAGLRPGPPAHSGVVTRKPCGTGGGRPRSPNQDAPPGVGASS